MELLIDAFRLVFAIWWAYCYFLILRHGSGWLRIFYGPLMGFAMAAYLPVLALEPAGAAFIKFIRDEIDKMR